VNDEVSGSLETDASGAESTVPSGPQRTRRRPRRHATIAVLFFGLWLLAYSFGAGLARSANSQRPPTLSGEELSVSVAYPLFQADRIQPSRFANNPMAVMWYRIGWATRAVRDPLSARTWKAAVAALGPALLFLLGLRLGRTIPTAVLPAVALMATAGFLSFSWVAIEAGLDLPAGILGVTVASLAFRRPYDLAGPAAAGLILAAAALTYPASLAFVAPAAYFVARQPAADALRRALRIASLGVGFLGPVVALKLALHAPTTFLLGGGTQTHEGFAKVAGTLVSDLFVGPGRFGKAGYYYLAGKHAAVSVIVILMALVGLLGARRARGSARPMAVAGILLISASAVLAMASGGPPGVRRALPAVVGVCMLTAFCPEAIPGKGALHRTLRGAAPLLLVLQAVVLQAHLAHELRRGLIRVPRDWTFVGVGSDDIRADARVLAAMSPEQLDLHLRSTQSEPVRTLALVEAERRWLGEPAGDIRAMRMRFWRCEVAQTYPGDALDPLRRCRW
jgi:hypothetical protein